MLVVAARPRNDLAVPSIGNTCGKWNFGSETYREVVAKNNFGSSAYGYLMCRLKCTAVCVGDGDAVAERCVGAVENGGCDAHLSCWICIIVVPFVGVGRCAPCCCHCKCGCRVVADFSRSADCGRKCLCRACYRLARAGRAAVRVGDGYSICAGTKSAQVAVGIAVHGIVIRIRPCVGVAGCAAGGMYLYCAVVFSGTAVVVRGDFYGRIGKFVADCYRIGLGAGMGVHSV